jgi:hypothetical protein
VNHLWLPLLLVLLINLPFGYWRAGVRRFSPAWFVSVHAPVPLAIGVRLLAGVGFRLAVLPLFVGTFFLGQFVGGRFRHWRGQHRDGLPSSEAGRRRDS